MLIELGSKVFRKIGQTQTYGILIFILGQSLEVSFAFGYSDKAWDLI